MKYGSALLCLGILILPLTGFSQSPSFAHGDLNCDQAVDVVDVVLSINIALGLPLSTDLDGNSDNVPDACAAATVTPSCGPGTEINEAGDQCVALVTEQDVENAYSEGVASVDVTVDNEAVMEAAYQEGYAAGLAGEPMPTPACGVKIEDVGAQDGLFETFSLESEQSASGMAPFRIQVAVQVPAGSMPDLETNSSFDFGALIINGEYYDSWMLFDSMEKQEEGAGVGIEIGPFGVDIMNPYLFDEVYIVTFTGEIPVEAGTNVVEGDYYIWVGNYDPGGYVTVSFGIGECPEVFEVGDAPDFGCGSGSQYCGNNTFWDGSQCTGVNGANYCGSNTSWEGGQCTAPDPASYCGMNTTYKGLYGCTPTETVCQSGSTWSDWTLACGCNAGSFCGANTTQDFVNDQWICVGTSGADTCGAESQWNGSECIGDCELAELLAKALGWQECEEYYADDLGL